MQKVADLDDNFKYNTYLKIIKNFNNIEELYNISKDPNKLKGKIKFESIDDSIIKLLTEDNIKEKVEKIYKNILENKLEIITIEDREYPQILKKIKEENSMFCIVTTEKIELNNKIVYIFFNNYFSKFSKTVIDYFAKINKSEKCVIISKYDSLKNDIYSMAIQDLSNEKIDINRKQIIFFNTKTYLFFVKHCIELLIIPEARYEDKIVEIVNVFLENGKDIYVVPANIFRKNSYFSNYLIQQGANVILSRKDLKYILNNRTC